MSYTYRVNPNDVHWATSKKNLAATFDKWGTKVWAIDCPTDRYSSSFNDPSDRFVRVTFQHPSREELTSVRVERFHRPMDNLWALALGLDSIRLNELRGLDDVAKQVYKALSSPVEGIYVMLGLQQGETDEATIKTAYRRAAAKAHPDLNGGSSAQMSLVNQAYEEVLRRAGLR